MAVAAGVVLVPEDAEASLRDALAAALEANRQFAEAAEELRRDYARACEDNVRLREENGRLRGENTALAAELEELRAGLAVLQRMVFGRSSEKSGPEPPGRDDAGGGEGRDRGSGTTGKKRGPGARAGRRDYSHLPRFEVIWDFPGAGTAARSAGCRSRCWARITCRSGWTGRCSCGCGRTAAAATAGRAAARGRRR